MRPRDSALRVSGEQLNESIWHVVIEAGPRAAASARVEREHGGRRRGPGGEWNSAAWAAVASGNVNQQGLDDALSAVKRTKQENAAFLRTLAAVYAELGKTSEALENLRRAVEVGGERPEDADWYVLGRIAERYGLDEIAAELYRKVPAKPAAGVDDA